MAHCGTLYKTHIGTRCGTLCGTHICTNSGIHCKSQNRVNRGTNCGTQWNSLWDRQTMGQIVGHRVIPSWKLIEKHSEAHNEISCGKQCMIKSGAKCVEYCDT